MRILKNSPFLRILLVVVVVIALVGAVLSYVVRGQVEADVHEQAALTARATFQHQVQMVLEPQDLAQPISGSRSRELDKLVDIWMPVHGAGLFRLWSPQGTVVYSRWLDGDGESQLEPGRLAAALGGDVAWAITREPGGPVEPGPGPVPGLGKIFAVYIPLSWEPGVVAGAMEVYLPYAPYGDQIASRTRLFLFLAPSLALALVAAFYVFFYTGWRAIRRARESALREELERKRAEGALRESEARSRALLEAIPDMMLRVRRDGTITDFKPSRRAEPYVSSAEFLGKNVSELLPPEVARQTMSLIERALKDGTVELFDYQLQGNVEERDFEARIVASGAAEVTVIARDITKRKQAEKRIEVLYEGEKKLRQEVESEIQRRAEFTRALVHEIKTPLIPVLASSELLVDELKGEPWSSLAKNIYRGASNLNDRIDGLLDVARGEMGMLESDLKPLYPLPLLQEVAGDMTAVAMSRSQSMSLDLPDSVPIVRADKGHLRQVLLNLLGNASKFTPEGGRITLSVAREDRYLIFSVRDTGPGIGEEARDQLFKAYYQVETSGPRRHGLGLGLTLCKNLVELHGGQIWVESQVGTGSTFSFSIPVEVSGQPAETPALAA